MVYSGNFSSQLGPLLEQLGPHLKRHSSCLSHCNFYVLLKGELNSYPLEGQLVNTLNFLAIFLAPRVCWICLNMNGMIQLGEYEGYSWWSAWLCVGWATIQKWRTHLWEDFSWFKVGESTSGPDQKSLMLDDTGLWSRSRGRKTCLQSGPYLLLGVYTRTWKKKAFNLCLLDPTLPAHLFLHWHGSLFL